jgi:hypothetical protein
MPQLNLKCSMNLIPFIKFNAINQFYLELILKHLNFYKYYPNFSTTMKAQVVFSLHPLALDYY